MPARVANRRRQSIRDVFHSIVRRTREWPADALLIAGDLFDQERVTRDTVAFILSELASLETIPVIIAPGNHDPFFSASPYATETWPNNVRVFSEPTWSTLSLQEGRLQIHGFAFDGFDISSNPYGALQAPENGAVHIAVAHGSERGHQPPDGKLYAPFDAASMVLPGLRYVALGHFHRVTEIKGVSGTAMWYPGMPEGQGFDETGPRHYLEVELEDDSIRVNPVVSSSVVYAVYEIDCTSLVSAQQIVDQLRAWSAQASTPQVARVTLSGACRPSIVAELSAIRDASAGGFEHLLLLDETTPAEDFEELARETSTLGAFIRRLNEEIRDAPDLQRKHMLERAREVGLAAHRDQKMAVQGLDVDGDGS
jgi:DNA repair exonuclease SbcCD nuclease subunit